MKKIYKSLKHFVKKRPSLIYNTVHLTYKCTQRCLQCNFPSFQTKNPFITLADFRTMVTKLYNYGTRILVLSGGEPMLHPQLEEIFQEVTRHNFSRIQFLSNLYGPEELVKRTIDLLFKYKISLTCSFDGFDDVADHLRGGTQVSAKVMQAIEYVNKKNRETENKIKTSATVTLNKININQLPRIIDFLERVNWRTSVDLYRWTSDTNKENADLKIIDVQELTSALQEITESPVLHTPLWLYDGYPAYLQNEQEKICPYLKNRAFAGKFFISPDGELYACLGDSVGNILEQELEDIFKSEKYAEFLQLVENCAGCWNSCYTLSSSFKCFLHIPTIKQYFRLFKKDKMLI